MPTTSIDTFFACTLMVIVIVSAMAATSNISYSLINASKNSNASERCAQISRYILLNEGNPPNWGEINDTVPTVLGLAEIGSSTAYKLDKDKVTRCNPRNMFSVNYGQVYSLLGMPDISFEIEIRTIFDVEITQTAIIPLQNRTTYQFKILTEKTGLPLETNINAYLFAEDYFDSITGTTSNGETSISVTLDNQTKGPVLLTVLAQSVADGNMISYGSYAFAHNSAPPELEGSFLNLSPLNQSVEISVIGSDISLSQVYAIEMIHNSTLQGVQIGNQTYSLGIPHFLDSGPTLIVATGHKGSAFFAEWTAYPQLPLRFGADLTDVSAASSVSSHYYVVSVRSTSYICIVRMSGVKQ